MGKRERERRVVLLDTSNDRYAHQKQLVASFETLLTHSLFSEKPIVTWPFFCNVLQEFFCTHLMDDDEPIESGKVGEKTRRAQQKEL